jgi:catechol 2,3-dioxygenase-like lactoylglutathione lyase family enzyme
MNAKVHLHLQVSDLAKSREFYQKFFGGAPVKEKPGYLKFLPDWAPVNLALGVSPELRSGGRCAPHRLPRSAAGQGPVMLRAEVMVHP